ncbi:TIGR03364 family FAD-dependent oxidoreductase [Desertihabitans aurantiacus]|uniref:TIGR03364 family FAD-dependent oxidoreductase n=1 Tax=Desertihabitans aurantiacus TaxID=2282477 RepID=UPI0018E528E8|nr:TIGR03364 family FAD-dependent oxidoreductase [Desertihabitans aurantiacus]
MTEEQRDLVVVGAGVVGMAHAVTALRRGMSVTVLDRDAEAVGASVRNFGHICITAQSGELRELGLRSREGWLEASEAVGFWAGEVGAVAVARTPTELAVLEELAASRDDASVTVLSAAETRRRLDGCGADDLVGGAFLAADLRVDPRVTVAALASWVDDQPDGEVRWRTAVTGVEPGVVHTTRGPVRARQVLVCVGHDVDQLLPALAEEHQITRCSLEMARGLWSGGQPTIGPAVLSATSMLRYDAFTAQPSSAALRAEVESATPELLAVGANVMTTQLPDGSFVLGDSHAYGPTVRPFLSEATSVLLVGAAGRLLGARFDVIERWQGVYAYSPVAPLLDLETAPGVRVVGVTSGIGMTLSFGLARRTLDSLA